MSLLRVFLFGRFEVRCDSQALAGFDARKVQELFCYLLLYRDRPHPREALADLLWDGNHTDQPGRCLRKALWQLRAALDAQAEPLSDLVLLVEPSWIQLNPAADVWLDASLFEQAFKGVQHLQGCELDEQGVQILQDAVELYKGGLQESWYEDWYLFERERFQHLYLSMLDKLMDYCEAHEQYAAGLSYGSLILGCEKARERTHRRLMRLYYLAGDRTAALRQYARCAEVLDRELGVGPATSTVALYEQIRTDRLDHPAPKPAEVHQAPPAAAEPLLPVLHKLTHLQGVLGQVQQEIHQSIQTVELAMKDRH
jgi:DNA-binding SARP family transcriptional activator